MFILIIIYFFTHIVPSCWSIFSEVVFGGEAPVGRGCVEAVGPLSRYVFG